MESQKNLLSRGFGKRMERTIPPLEVRKPEAVEEEGEEEDEDEEVEEERKEYN